ncbi:MAG: hypothetical protein DRI57_24105, partial [Deltaproteobacteria bacterium]
TGLQTPSGRGQLSGKHSGRGCKPRPAEGANIPDGVANPVRQRPRPAEGTLLFKRNNQCQVG